MRCGRTARSSRTSPTDCALRGNARGEIASACTQALENLGLGPARRPAAAPALRRPAAARRDRARARLQPAGRAHGRAAVEPRCQAARGGARVAARADRPARALGAGRHARPDRGDGDVRQDPAAQLRAASSSRARPSEMYNRPQTHVHRRVHGQQQSPARNDRRVAGRARAARGRRLRLWGCAPRRSQGRAIEPTGSSGSSGRRRAYAPGDNRIPAELVTAMFMGDRSEHLFKLGALRLRCYGEPASPMSDRLARAPRGRSLGVRRRGLRPPFRPSRAGALCVTIQGPTHIPCSLRNPSHASVQFQRRSSGAARRASWRRRPPKCSTGAAPACP